MAIHPFRRSWLAALVPVLMMVLWGSLPVSDLFFNPGKAQLLLAGGVVLGAFLGALPRRIRNRRQTREKVSVRACLTAFFSGAVMLCALRLARLDEVRAAAGAMQGGVGPLAFVGIAWLAALLTASLKRRRGT